MEHAATNKWGNAALQWPTTTPRSTPRACRGDRPMNSFARSLNRLHSGPLARASPLSLSCRATSTAVLASGEPKLGAAAIATNPNKDRSSYLSKNSELWVLARTSTAAAQCGRKHRPWSSSAPSARRGPQFAAQARTNGNAASRTSFCAL